MNHKSQSTQSHTGFTQAPKSVNLHGFLARFAEPDEEEISGSEFKRLNSRCAKALEQAANKENDPTLNPFRTDANGNRRLRGISDDETCKLTTFYEYKRWASLPSVASDRRWEILPALILHCSRKEYRKGTLCIAVITHGQRCKVDDVGAAMEALLDKNAKHFRESRRAHNRDPKRTPETELVFAAAEISVREKNGELHKDPVTGELLYHVHGHVIFHVPRRMKKTQWKTWLAEFQEKLGGTHVRCEKVRDVVRACAYTAKLQQVRDILDAGEFVRWHKQILGRKLQRSYNSFSEFKRWLKERGKKVVREYVYDPEILRSRWRVRRVSVQSKPVAAKNPAKAKSPLPENQPLRKLYRTMRDGSKRAYTIWANPTLAGEPLYESAGVARWETRY